MPLSNASRWCAAYPEPAEAGLVRKYDIVPLLYVALSFWATESHLSLCCNIVMGSRSNGHQADKSCCCKRRCTIGTVTDVLQTCPFSDKWFVMWLYGFAKMTQNMSVVSGVSQGRELKKSSTPLNLTLSNPLILYSNDKGWMSTSTTGYITEQLYTLSLGRNLGFIEFRNLLVCIFSNSRDIARYSEQTLTLQSAIQVRNPLQNFCFMQCSRCHFSLPRHLNVEMLTICMSQSLLHFMQFWRSQISPSWCCNFNG